MSPKPKIPKLTKLPAQSKKYKKQTVGYKKYYAGKKLSKRGKYGPMGEIPDSLIFSILPKPQLILLLKDKNMSDLFRREVRLFYGRVVDHISKNIVGDPRVGSFDEKGKVPKGGTGRMRLATRAYITNQFRRSTSFPFRFHFAIPVAYAKPTLHEGKNVKHSNERGNRVVAWVGGRIVTRMVNLNDPQAVNDIKEIITACIEHSGDEFKRLLNRYSIELGFTSAKADNFFILEPTDFRDRVVR